MTPSQAGDLLALAAAYDQRTVGTSDALAWGAALEHIDFHDARQAVIEHYRRTDKRLTPADVTTGVRRIRNQRIQAAGDPPPDADPDNPTAYRQALAAGRHAIASNDLKTRPVEALTVGQTIPKADYRLAAQRARRITAQTARERIANAEREDPELAERIRQARAEARAELDQRRTTPDDTTSPLVRDQQPMNTKAST